MPQAKPSRPLRKVALHVPLLLSSVVFLGLPVPSTYEARGEVVLSPQTEELWQALEYLESHARETSSNIGVPGIEPAAVGQRRVEDLGISNVTDTTLESTEASRPVRVAMKTGRAEEGLQQFVDSIASGTGATFWSA